ncbi:Mrp/NBP35 family ATP-binding protein [Methanobacterium alcaliphilum]|uniref:Mrp/NBP35 family ATP-binding protein n=1 Tax=Methanobacterium alcaliphilum TaxID=392018 RepID=UPI00200B1683|nr:Mrp/NBP35 family ATP-binding protein [Methanobacterium alcaliphilum]MCK9151527.1 Mrp/NBP35 family ATP-binding protein [Methanobacterium alcaliphilum]
MKQENSVNNQKLAVMEQDIKIARSMSLVTYKIAVMSGKGGVGKSTVTVNLAESFVKKGYKTGILDADLHGPNVPKMLGIHKTELMVDENGMVPVETANGIKVMSTEFLLPHENSPIIWRGPKKTGAIRQFLSDVNWENLDVLLIDNPPGTGDEPLTILQSIPSLDGMVIVTTPQSVSLEDVEKCINMAKKLNIRIFGVIENMSGFICPHCNEEIFIFGRGGGEEISKKFDIPFLGFLPLDINTYQASEEGLSIIDKDPGSEISKRILDMVTKVEENLKNKRG